MTNSAQDAIELVSRKWGGNRTRRIWRGYVKPRYLELKRKHRKAVRSGRDIPHPFAELF